MAGDAVQRRPVTRTVAEVAENPLMLSFEGPWMPGTQSRRRGGAQGRQWPPFGEGVADRACVCQNLIGLADVSVVMAPETAGPVAVPDVVWIGGPVYFHRGKNIPVVNRKDGVDRLLDLSLLTLENVREMSCVILFDKLPHFFTDIFFSIVALNQGI